MKIQENNLQQPSMQKNLLDYHDFNGDNIGDGKAPEKKHKKRPARSAI